MITEDYVTFETAKQLKEKGFDVYGDGSYNSGIEIYKEYSPNGKLNSCATFKPHPKGYPAPTLQIVMKWLREVHNLFIFISTWLRHKDGTVQYYYEIRNLNNKDFETIAESTIIEFDSPEKTCEAAIKYCLENLI